MTHDACVITLDCDDADLCTTESCDAGICRRQGLGCDDADACTIDQCSGGICQNTPIVCDDGDVCTSDACAAGSCQFTPTVDLAAAVAKLDEFRAQLAGSPCAGVALTGKLNRKLKKLGKKARGFLSRADDATKANVIERLLGKAGVLLPRARDLIAQAVLGGVIPAECGAFLDGFLGDASSCANG